MSIATIEITVTAKPPCNKTYIIHIATLDCQLATRSVHTIAAAAHSLAKRRPHPAVLRIRSHARSHPARSFSDLPLVAAQQVAREKLNRKIRSKNAKRASNDGGSNVAENAGACWKMGDRIRK